MWLSVYFLAACVAVDEPALQSFELAKSMFSENRKGPDCRRIDGDGRTLRNQLRQEESALINGDPRAPSSPGERSDAPIIIGADCAQVLLREEDKGPTIALSGGAFEGCRFRGSSSALAVAAYCSAAFRVALACISVFQIVACTTGGTTGAPPREGSILPPGNWRLVLDDEFNGSSVDRSIWTGIVPDGGGIDSQGCAVNSLAISVSGGFLTLRGVDPSHCPDPNYHPAGVCSSPCAGGEIITSPIYGPGYYEARLKSAGNYNAFWLEAQIIPCAPLDKGGFESDIMESWGDGYQNNTHWGGYGDCHQSSPAGSLSPIADRFHVMGVLWDPAQGLTYYRDGQQTSHVPGPVGSAPVDIRFTALGYTDSNVPLLVDWVRYYAPL
jgi:putative component of membrane protein insertase Oxa1/YidC/SpoIIIJ protein YidD